ncbi:MAG: DUF542 domain-containing protein [Myxococcaceae bacterium]|nr:DUF542 domain-containing protein [Myxococcaceae bacterium]
MVSPTVPLATLVLDHPSVAQVLQRYRLDFCCDGHQTLEEAARRRALDLELVTSALEEASAQPDLEALDLRTLTTRELVHRATSLHHLPLRRTVPLVQALADQVKAQHPRLAEAVEALGAALLPHLEDESQVMFPALLSSSDRARTLQLIELADRDHRVIVEQVLALRDLAADYVTPAGACASTRSLFNELRWLETDVLALIHLETHVLQARFRHQEQPP